MLLWLLPRPLSLGGWAMASSGVTSASSSRTRPRNGPPDAVRMSRATSSARPPRKAWAKAECSESTAINCPGAARPVTSFPPITRDSLFARARVRPAPRAARVGSSPAAPVMAFTTTSQSRVANSVAASGPVSRRGTSTPRAASSRSRSAVFSCLARATHAGRNLATCPASRSMLPPEAASATTSKRSRREAITSSVWVPMDPVEPSRTIRRTRTVCHDAPTVSRRNVAGPPPLGGGGPATLRVLRRVRTPAWRSRP